MSDTINALLRKARFNCDQAAAELDRALRADPETPIGLTNTLEELYSTLQTMQKLIGSLVEWTGPTLSDGRDPCS